MGLRPHLRKVMPSYNHKNGSKYGWITELDGPWQVYSSMQTNLGVIISCFGIINIQNGQHKAMPKQIQSRRARNRFDMAMEQATERNVKYRNAIYEQVPQGYNSQRMRRLIINALSEMITSENAHCISQNSELAMKRRIEDINRIARSTIEALHRADILDSEKYGVFSAISVRDSHKENQES